MNTNLTKTNFLLFVQTGILAQLYSYELPSHVRKTGLYLKGIAVINMLEDAEAVFDAGWNLLNDVKDFVTWAMVGTEFARFKDVLGQRKTRPY